MSETIKKGDRVRVNTGGFDPRDGQCATVLAVKGSTVSLRFDDSQGGSLEYGRDELEKL